MTQMHDLYYPRLSNVSCKSVAVVYRTFSTTCKFTYFRSLGSFRKSPSLGSWEECIEPHTIITKVDQIGPHADLALPDGYQADPLNWIVT